MKQTFKFERDRMHSGKMAGKRKSEGKIPSLAN